MAFLAAAERSLDLALYDVRLPGAVGDSVAGALRDAADRGVALRLLYNLDSDRPVPVPPPPDTRPSCSRRCRSRPRACPACPT